MCLPPNGFFRKMNKLQAAVPPTCALHKRISDSSCREEHLPTRTLAPPDPQQDVRCNHWHVGKFGDLRHAGMRSSLVSVARQVDFPSRGRFAMVSRIAKELDRDAELDPLGESAGDKALGAISRSEARACERVFDSDVFAHGYRRADDRVAGMPARELRIEGCGICERPACLWETAVGSSLLNLYHGIANASRKKRSGVILFLRSRPMGVIVVLHV